MGLKHTSRREDEGRRHKCEEEVTRILGQRGAKNERQRQ